MDPGVRTPLVDFFLRGEVARDARLLAAQGALATRALEQLALLVLLHDDPDHDVALAARQTIAALPIASVSAFLGRSDVPAELREFFAMRGIAAGPPTPPAGDEPLVETHEDLPPLPDASDGEDDQGPAALSALPVLDRLKLATKGTREQRAVLIRDPNKMVAVAVLSSPKVSENEIEAFARMGNVSDDVLRIIAGNRSWTKNYGVVLALVRNSKTPPALSMNFIHRLNERDLKALGTDRNVPEGLRMAARKFIVKQLNR
jgi:hypothetical protein